MQPTQKETDLLKDLKGEEQLCVDKYTEYSSRANDPQLRNLFSQIAQTEQQHLDTITQMMSGTVPQGGGSSSSQPTFTAYYTSETEEKKQDAHLCADLLATEKHTSSMYDTSVFEFADEAARSTLNHIQKEEQGHGKALYDYMSVNGMYN